MIRIRRLAVVATATTLAIAGGAVVLVFMLFALVLGSLGAGSAMMMPIGGALALVLAPLLYAAFVWIVVALGCLAYNVASSFTGGVGFTVEREGGPHDHHTPLQGDRPADGAGAPATGQGT